MAKRIAANKKTKKSDENQEKKTNLRFFQKSSYKLFEKKMKVKMNRKGLENIGIQA